MTDYHGVPRFHEEDRSLWDKEPIKEEFKRHTANHSRDSLWQNALVAQLVNSAHWTTIIEHWIQYCIGFNFKDMSPDTAALVFVQVLWLEYCGLAYDAERTLIKAQAMCGPEVNMYTREAIDDVTVNIDYIYDEVESLASHNCRRWNKVLRCYFCLDTDQIPSQSDLASTVKTLQEMRTVTKSAALKAEFQKALKDSGLSMSLAIITDPHTRREVNFPHIQVSDQKYHWRSFLGEVWHRWTPANVYSRKYQEPEFGKTRIQVSGFIRLLCEPKFIASMKSSAEQIFFLSSEENFKFEFVRWIKPTVRSMNPEYLPAVETWDVIQLFNEICSLNLVDSYLDSSLAGWETAKLVLHEARAQRKHKKHVNKQMRRVRRFDQQGNDKSSPMPRNIRQTIMPYDEADMSRSKPAECPKCAGLAPQEKCRYTIKVHRCTPEAQAKLHRSLCTCAPANDVFVSSALLERETVSPISMLEIAHRPSVFQRCEIDEVLLVNADSDANELVGGVKFEAWDIETLGELQEHHSDVATWAKVSTRSAQNQISGDLRTVGHRVPDGGRPGDGYGPYAHQSVESDEGIKALFATGQDSDTLLETVRLFAPDVERAIKTRRTEANLNRMGTTGMTSFYCWEYTAPLHKDHDDGWSIACQLWKNAKPDEYNFVYAEWGCYIRTAANCVWFFNPRDVHGTALPRASTAALSISRGIHTTIRRKEVAKASLFEDVRVTFDERSQYWAQST